MTSESTPETGGEPDAEPRTASGTNDDSRGSSSGRRRFLGGLAAASLPLIAGCSVSDTDEYTATPVSIGDDRTGTLVRPWVYGSGGFLLEPTADDQLTEETTAPAEAEDESITLTSSYSTYELRWPLVEGSLEEFHAEHPLWWDERDRDSGSMVGRLAGDGGGAVASARRLGVDTGSLSIVEGSSGSSLEPVDARYVGVFVPNTSMWDGDRARAGEFVSPDPGLWEGDGASGLLGGPVTVLHSSVLEEGACAACADDPPDNWRWAPEDATWQLGGGDWEGDGLGTVRFPTPDGEAAIELPGDPDRSVAVTAATDGLVVSTESLYRDPGLGDYWNAGDDASTRTDSPSFLFTGGDHDDGVEDLPHVEPFSAGDTLEGGFLVAPTRIAFSLRGEVDDPDALDAQVPIEGLDVDGLGESAGGLLGFVDGDRIAPFRVLSGAALAASGSEDGDARSLTLSEPGVVVDLTEELETAGRAEFVGLGWADELVGLGWADELVGLGWADELPVTQALFLPDDPETFAAGFESARVVDPGEGLGLEEVAVCYPASAHSPASGEDGGASTRGGEVFLWDEIYWEAAGVEPATEVAVTSHPSVDLEGSVDLAGYGDGDGFAASSAVYFPASADVTFDADALGVDAEVSPGVPDYSPGVPDYSPGVPDYSPDETDSSPGVPDYSPGVPDYSPGVPDYSPGVPDYSPGVPDYSPGVPDYSPGVPDYDPGVTVGALATPAAADLEDAGELAELSPTELLESEAASPFLEALNTMDGRPIGTWAELGSVEWGSTLDAEALADRFSGVDGLELSDASFETRAGLLRSDDPQLGVALVGRLERGDDVVFVATTHVWPVDGADRPLVGEEGYLHERTLGIVLSVGRLALSLFEAE